MITEDLGEDECGAFLVWGDPALYDSTLAILEEVWSGARSPSTMRWFPASAVCRRWRPDIAPD